ncbi:MAG: putative serine/threonine-protein kinase Nek3 [Streblomastix strix]|uniref:non-specific serine/threonine protein kinase n=1 Tax=Streblomastix strix TaxID=222440 RepID=A0A5J4VPP0_9EUKA|nr:MAG: putative serine/threonine-protein kinase Nek3 [Streblomastix strix]
MGNSESKPSKPHIWSDYEVVKELASGAYGRILVMKLKESGEIFVIKRLPYIDPQKKKMADEEVDTLKHVQSKYIVHFIQSFPQEIDLCLVMDYCTGGNLRQLIDNMKSWSYKDREDRSKKYFYQILAGINHLHDMGIIHRDLKPENILIDGEGCVRIADFGLAMKMESKSQIYAAGTKVYQPPEAHIWNKMTKESDIWALGVIVIEMLTSKYPYEGGSLDVIIANIKKGKTINLSEISADMRVMILEMIQVDQSKRPSAQELLSNEIMKAYQQQDLDYGEPFKSAQSSPQRIQMSSKIVINQSTEEEGGINALTRTQQLRQELMINDNSPQLQKKTSNVLNSKKPFQKSKENTDEDLEEEQNQSDMTLIECERCHQKIPFSEYQRHYNEHTGRQSDFRRMEVSTQRSESEDQSKSSLASKINFKKVVDMLQQPFIGTEEQKKKIQKDQETFCIVVLAITDESKTDDIRKAMINAGVIDALLRIFETRDLSTITRRYSAAFYIMTPTSDEVGLMLYDRKPYPGLIRLLEHKETDVVSNAITSINNILACEDNYSTKSPTHPHFNTMNQCGGIQKLFALFQRNLNKRTRDHAAICLGILFRAREIPDQNMRRSLIAHFMSLLKDQDDQLKRLSRSILRGISRNTVNRAEIMKGDFLNTLVTELKKPLVGNEQQKKEIMSLQENQCLIILALQEGPEDDELRKVIINAGVADAIIRIFESRDLSDISPIYSVAYFILTPTGDDIGIMLYQKKPFPGLLRILDHTNIEVVSSAISSIKNIVASGQNTTSDTSVHPHYDTLNQCGGITKIYQLFQRNLSKRTRDHSAISLAMLFRAREISDTSMRKQIIQHFIILMNNLDEGSKKISRSMLRNLSRNKANRTEMIGGDFPKALESELRKPVIGNEEQKKEIMRQQENKCFLVYLALEGPEDDDLRKNIINSGAVEAFLRIFETYEFSVITKMMTAAFYILTPTEDDISMMICEKKPFPGLLRLFDHPDDDIVSQSISSIKNIVASGQNTTSDTSVHPHYDTLNQCGGITKIYQLFQRNLSKRTRDHSAISLAMLFRAREISDTSMRKQIISHLITLLKDPEESVNRLAKVVIRGVARNSVNRAEIMKGDFLNTLAADLKKPLVGNEEQKKVILRQQEISCRFLVVLFEERKDDDGRRQIINSGIFEAILRILESWPIPSISRYYSQALAHLIHPSGDEVISLMFSKKPYSGLIRVLDSQDTRICYYTIISIFNILHGNSTSDKTIHPHFKTVIDCQGDKKIFQLFQRNMDKDINDKAAMCIAFLYRAQEIKDSNMKKDIIAHLKKLIQGKDFKEITQGFLAIGQLAMNQANRSEIEKGGFKLPM